MTHLQIKQLRIIAGLSRSDLASRLGVSAQEVQRMEMDPETCLTARKPGKGMIARIREACRLTKG